MTYFLFDFILQCLLNSVMIIIHLSFIIIIMSSIPVYETSLTRSIKFWIFLICQIPSILCSLFILYHIFTSPAHRQTLANHTIMVMIIISFFSVTIDLSITMNYLQIGALGIQSPFLCYLWMFIDYVLYAQGMLMLSWATIERHILVFASQWYRTSSQKFFGHYLPIVICLIYPILFNIYTIFFYSCDQIIDYHQYLCNSPCFKSASFLLNGYDQLIHTFIPFLIIVVFSLALLIRVIRHKRRVQRVSFSWRRQRRMVVQLLSIACLYIIMITPPSVVSIIRISLSKTFATTEYALYIAYLYYFLTLFIPFVCLGSVGDLRKKFNSLFQTFGCYCLMRTSRVEIFDGQTPMIPITVMPKTIF